jgi:4-amino-4-deoxy-L-arabinose transferase-like glycosyltransferase
MLLVCASYGIASALDSFISPHVILPALLCLSLILLFLWLDRQNRNRKP